jgi:hypothetical protein
MSDDESREWNFQLNIAGLALLLFASGYIGQHLAVLLPLSGLPSVLVHYSGELVLTALTVGAAMWKAYGASEQHRGRVGWLKRSAVWFYVGAGAVMLNLLLLTALLLLGKLR